MAMQIRSYASTQLSVYTAVRQLRDHVLFSYSIVWPGGFAVRGPHGYVGTSLHGNAVTHLRSLAYLHGNVSTQQRGYTVT